MSQAGFVQKAHVFLHDSAITTATVWSLEQGKFQVTLNDQHYQLEIDPRDRRVLVIFDGEILFGGLPKNATVLKEVDLPCLTERSCIMRALPEHHETAVPDYENCGEHTVLLIKRYFILLPSCRAIVRKYKMPGLRPAYVTIVVQNAKHGKQVEWLPTSY